MNQTGIHLIQQIVSLDMKRNYSRLVYLRRRSYTLNQGGKRLHGLHYIRYRQRRLNNLVRFKEIYHFLLKRPRF